jgi:hypothetical protein
MIKSYYGFTIRLKDLSRYTFFIQFVNGLDQCQKKILFTMKAHAIFAL